MERELQQIKSLFNSNEVIVRKCGIGKVNAALGAAELIAECRPDVVISSGCAGGNGTEIEVGDVVISTETCYHDVYCGLAEDGSCVYGQVQGMPARYAGSPMLLAIADKMAAQDGRSSRLHKGLIVTGDWFVDSREKMESIVNCFPEAKAVDMESAAIAQTCYKMQVPFVSFRVISDIPLRDNNAAQYHDFWTMIADSSFHTTRQFIELLLRTGS